MLQLENSIRREDLAYRLAKALEVRGSLPSLVLDGTVVPVVMVEDLSQGNEQDFAVSRWARGHGSTPVGAQFGKLSFNNPVGSGVLVKVYQVQLQHTQTAVPDLEVGMSIETASTGGAQLNFAKGFTDSRLSFGDGNPPIAFPTRLPVVDIRTDNSGGLGTHFARFFIPPSGSVKMDLGGWVLRPGTRLHFEALAIGEEYNANVEWTEANL